MLIIQGSNEPIFIDIGKGEDDITAFSAVLVSKKNNTILKHWKKDDVTFEDEIIRMELTEAETMGFDAGIVTLAVKWLDDGSTWFAQETDITVKAWIDKTRLT